MALIQRPVKTLGNREYAQEKAANPNEPIKSAEVDGDLDTIYALVNGQLDTANLKASANIVGTQLAPGANILASQLAPGAGITVGQISPGSTLRGVVTASPVLTSITTTETPICTLPSLSTHGGLVIIAGWWDATVDLLATAGGTTGVVTIRVKRDGTGFWAITPTFGVSPNISITVALPAPVIFDSPSPVGAHVYSITAVSNTANISIASGTSGNIWAVEFA
jgi:hypothetical protein